jgi:hypothetical protein
MLFHCWRPVNADDEHGYRDVGAVAVYELPDTTRVYYSKHEDGDRCRAHVTELGELVGNAANDTQVSRKQMSYAYFQLMLSNAKDKMNGRLQNLKGTIGRQPALPRCWIYYRS